MSVCFLNSTKIAHSTLICLYLVMIMSIFGWVIDTVMIEMKHAQSDGHMKSRDWCCMTILGMTSRNAIYSNIAPCSGQHTEVFPALLPG